MHAYSFNTHALSCARTHVHTHAYTHTQACTRTHIRTHAHAPVHTYAHTRMHSYTRIHTRTHVHVHTHTHTHTHTLTHAHAHTSRLQVWKVDGSVHESLSAQLTPKAAMSRGMPSTPPPEVSAGVGAAASCLGLLVDVWVSPLLRCCMRTMLVGMLLLLLKLRASG